MEKPQKSEDPGEKNSVGPSKSEGLKFVVLPSILGIDFG